MSFASLAARSRTFAARAMSGVTYAWFPVTATTAPDTRDGYSVRVRDVLKGAARQQASDMAGLINERERTFPISIPSGTLTYDPIEGETVFLCGEVKATELECKQETQVMP